MKITININGKEESISIEEARKIYDELSLIFGAKTNPYADPFAPWKPGIAPKYPKYPVHPDVIWSTWTTCSPSDPNYTITNQVNMPTC